MTDSKTNPADPPLIDENELVIHRLYRERIVQEDNLINHRMMWMILSQAFMFALWAAIMKAGDDQSPHFYLFGYVVDVTGALFAVGGWFSIAAARGEINELRRNYLQFYPNSNEGERASKAANKFIARTSVRRDILPGLTGSKHFHRMGHIVDWLMPLWLALMWAVLAAIQLGLLHRFGIG